MTIWKSSILLAGALVADDGSPLVDGKWTLNTGQQKWFNCMYSYGMNYKNCTIFTMLWEKHKAKTTDMLNMFQRHFINDTESN